MNLSGRGPSICYRRPFCRLKAPLGLSLLRCASQTRSMRFERSGRGQEPSRGHKFSILENFLSIRDFTSAMRPHFRSDLVGACLPQTLLRTDEEELCQFDAIPPTYREKQSVPDCWVSVKLFSKNDTATACQDWLRSTRLGRGSIKSHVRTVKVLGMGLFAFQERVHLWKGVTH